jgi:cytochrome P450
MEDKSGNPNNLEFGEIDAEINIMLNAGSTTTAIALANVMFHLLKHPHILAKLREEIDRALDPDEIIAPYDSVKNLPYLRACLDESLRIVSPTTQNLGRVTPPEGMQILDDFIPGGVSVSMSAHVVHHDATVFPEPEKYIPERWLGEAGKKLQPYFLAFSAGARGCIGRNISYLEQTVLIASLLHRYEFALPSPEFEVSRLETMNMLVGDIWLKVWRREIPGLTVESEKA